MTQKQKETDMRLIVRPIALRSISILALAAAFVPVLFCASPAQAQTSVVIGTNTVPNLYPFSAHYQGEYQQMYSASALSGLGSGPVTITSIAFKSMNLGTTAFDFTYAMSYTAAAPATMLADYAANKGGSSQTYTGPATFTSQNNGLFDFVLPTSFTYDPSQGNLLLDVTLVSASGDDIGFAMGASNDTNRVFNAGGNGAPTVGGSGPASYGLQTQFMAVPAPEPSSLTVLALAGLSVTGLLIRARKRQASTHAE